MENICSTNLKTGYSINLPIQKTCSPTSVCKVLCYAKRGRLSWDISLDRQERVFKIFARGDLEAIADQIIREYNKHHLTFLRWCGSGDLSPRAVSVINIIARKYPSTVHWIATRKVSSIKNIIPSENMFLMFSLDNSKESIQRKKQIDKMEKERVYYSYLRQEEDEMIPPDVKIIFNAQHKKLSFNDPARMCPVDAGVKPIKDACATCRKCFEEKLFERSTIIL